MWGAWFMQKGLRYFSNRRKAGWGFFLVMIMIVPVFSERLRFSLGMKIKPTLRKDHLRGWGQIMYDRRSFRKSCIKRDRQKGLFPCTYFSQHSSDSIHTRSNSKFSSLCFLPFPVHFSKFLFYLYQSFSFPPPVPSQLRHSPI